jgi:transcriptional regulator with XRE-family HTH domain
MAYLARVATVGFVSPLSNSAITDGDAVVYTQSCMLRFMEKEQGLAGSLLWLARDGAGMTQTEVAKAAGVPQSTVSAYERGERQPTLPMLLKLIRATGQDLRFHVTEPDRQSLATQQWERSRPAAEQEQWARERQARVAAT